MRGCCCPKADAPCRSGGKLSFVGAVSVAVAIDKHGGIAGDPSVELSGVPERGEGNVDMLDRVLDTVVSTLEGLPKARRRDADALAETLERAVRGGGERGLWGKKPVCHVSRSGSVTGVERRPAGGAGARQ